MRSSAAGLMQGREADVHTAVAEAVGDASTLAGAERLKRKVEEFYRKRRIDPPEIEIVNLGALTFGGSPVYALRSTVRFETPKAKP